MSARDDYPITQVWLSDRLGEIIDMHHAACAEIDRLRAAPIAEYPHEFYCPSIDVCAICGEIYCPGCELAAVEEVMVPILRTWFGYDCAPDDSVHRIGVKAVSFVSDGEQILVGVPGVSPKSFMSSPLHELAGFPSPVFLTRKT